MNIMRRRGILRCLLVRNLISGMLSAISVIAAKCTGIFLKCHIFLQFSFKKCHCFLSRHKKNRFLTKCCPICRTSIVYFHFYFLLPNDLLQFWHLHTQKQVHEQEAYAINVPFSVFVFFPNFIWNSSYLNIIFASCIKLFSYFGCQHCIKFFFLLQICCPFLCHSESIHSP